MLAVHVHSHMWALLHTGILALARAPTLRPHAPAMRSFASVRATGKELLQRFPTLDVLLVGLGCS